MDLFGNDHALPPGFDFRPEFIDAGEELRLVRDIERLAFSRVEMRGGVAKRRTAHFGVTYGFDARTGAPGPAIPGFLLDVRARAAEWAGLSPDAFVEALVTEYAAGAGIGWHRDAPMFGDVIGGVSLLSACRMKFRPYVSPADLRQVKRPRRTSHDVPLTARSGYLISGVARRDFEHSIPETEALRYSITFRTPRGRRPSDSVDSRFPTYPIGGSDSRDEGGN